MRASYLSESKNYQASLRSFDMNGVELSAHASNVYADALIKQHEGSMNDIKRLLNDLNKKTPKQPPNQTYQDYFTSLTKGGVLAARIIVLQLEAMIAHGEQNHKKEIAYLKNALALEEEISVGYGPPIPVKASRELLAQARHCILPQDKKPYFHRLMLPEYYH
jgi:hypothetical protein